MLQITNLASKSASHRAWMLGDRRSRTRLTFELATAPAHPISDWQAASLMMLLVSHLGGNTPDDVEVQRIDPVLGTPSVESFVRFDIRINQEPVVACFTFTAELDVALDGEADQWRRTEVNVPLIYPAAAALAYHVACPNA